jgi:hypothetical protein
MLFGYSRETAIAEKLQALVQLRMLNSRMKDYYDLWLRSGHPELNLATLREAIQRTFQNRNTAIEAAPVGLSTEFCNDPGKETQWRAFLKRSNLAEIPKSLGEIGEGLREFFGPILNELATSQRLAALDRLARDAHDSGVYEKNVMPKRGTDN